MWGAAGVLDCSALFPPAGRNVRQRAGSRRSSRSSLSPKTQLTIRLNVQSGHGRLVGGCEQDPDCQRLTWRTSNEEGVERG